LAKVKATARSAAALNPNALGSLTSDLVFTPVTPCRIVDTRNAGGPFLGGETRTFDFDGLVGAATTYEQQGGTAASCNLPFGTVTAAALNITATNTTTPGYLSAWGKGTRPNASVLNWDRGQTIANTTIVPVMPGPGTDFSIYGSTGTDVVIDVVGYFAAPAGPAAGAVKFGANILLPDFTWWDGQFIAPLVGVSNAGLWSPVVSIPSIDTARQGLPLASACTVTGYTAEIFTRSPGPTSVAMMMFFAPVSVLATTGQISSYSFCQVDVPAGSRLGSCTSTDSPTIPAGSIAGHQLAVVSGTTALYNALVFVSFSCQ
jgi:hypothetical protein